MTKRIDRLGARFGAVITAALGVGGMLALAPSAWAQAVSAAEQDVVVTALKHGERNVQDVPVAVTAFGEQQLEALNYQDLQSLTYVMPNVQLEDIGTARGIANFSIRGVGINSSIPSVDPTVGVFVDGMYYGINAGILADNFDLAGIEVLRGPQGVLFGRNVTGGAVVIRTAAPSDVFEASGGLAVETGLNYIADLAIGGPLMPGVLSARFSTYYNKDEGWFENDFDGSQFGEGELRIYRGALRLTPTNNLDMILRVEQGSSDGDGPASQNHGLHSRDSFDFAINNPGYGAAEWEQAILETNWDVAFGDGVITNILGWRDYQGISSGDIDATIFPAFHSRAVVEQDQWSNELRYAGTLGPVDLVLGHYMFQQNLFYIEERLLFGALRRVGGGDGDFSTWAAFANADWHLTDQLTLNLGVRYTEENKEARISRIRAATDVLDGGLAPGSGVVGGSIDNRTLSFSDSPFDLSWNDTSPRVGIQWEPSPDTNVYAYASRGFRSGGVNFRVTTFGNAMISGAPTAFDSEESTAYEIGIKQEFGGRHRVNVALYQNNIDDMQRETNIADPVAGVQQVIVNAGDATIWGAELEARFGLTENFMLQLQAGYTEGEYDTVTADLNGDGVINAADADLEIPRLAPWTYGVSLVHDLPILGGMLSSRVSYNHRDANFYTDNNRGTLNEADIVDANFTWRPDDGNWSFSIYGSNLTDEVTFGGDTQLPDAPCGVGPAPQLLCWFGGDGPGPQPPPTFSPLNKGRVIGARFRVDF